MTKRVKNLTHLQSEIYSALSLITQKGKSLANVAVPQKGLIAGTESLLERCQNVVSGKKNEKPVLRVIHHLACSGGTIFSKYIVAMPNVFLLSEALPNTPLVNAGSPIYSPTDIPSLDKFAKISGVDELNKKFFVKSITMAEKHVVRQGGKMVVRYHSHYCSEMKIPNRDRFISLLGTTNDIRQVLTI